MVCAGRARSKTTKMNERESGDSRRVSGHPKRTISDEVTASQSRRLFGKSRKSTRFFRRNPWGRAKNCLNPPKSAPKSQKIQKVFLKVVPGF